MWEVEFTDEFEAWWDTLSEKAQEDIAAVVELLMKKGVHLPFPYSSKIRGYERFSHLRELRKETDGQILRVIYAFDPRRTAILLLGGDKRGDKGWYEKFVPIAEEIYRAHLEELKREGGGE
jgi:hypothetical protein